MEPEEFAPPTPQETRQYPNLKPAKPGEVRNPKGRPKGALSFKTVLAKWMRIKEPTVNPITKKTMKLSQQDIIALSMIKEARNGNVQAFVAISDRLDGKPEQKQINAFEEGTEINLTIGKPKDIEHK